MKYFVTLVLTLAACSADESAQATSPTPARPTASLTWRERVAAELGAMDAAKRSELAALVPTGDVTDPRAAAVFIDRLARKADADAVRASLALALPKTGGVYADAVADLFADEPASVVRVAYVEVARRAPGESSLVILRRGFADPAIEVRTEAARSAAVHPAGARLASELRMALVDANPLLRAEAAHSLGTLKIEAAREELIRALGDAVPDVRLEAMRALDRIAPGTLAGTAQVAALASDPDERVAELAKKLAVRQ